MENVFDALRQYNYWGGEPIDMGFTRRTYLERIMPFVGNRLVKVLVGQRRAGKSYLLRQIAKQLIDNGVKPENTFMLNKDLLAFDGVRDCHDLTELFERYRRELKPEGKVYIFIDEVQNISEWERFVNSYSQDFTHDYELFLTGSNSKMLSGELASLLSGRYVEIEVFPFSFAEFCGMAGKEENRQSYIEYMQQGGMPEMLKLTGDEVRRNYVMALKDTILLRDIIQRESIKDPRLLEDLFVYLVNNTSTLFSINSLMKFYKGKGRMVSYEKLSQYLTYMSDAYLLHRTDRYNIRGKETIAGVCKYYANDLAFRNYLFQGTAHGVGYELENLVYLQLRRCGFTVYVGDSQGLEVDFVAMKGDRTVYLQATYMLVDEETVRREYASLQSIADHYEKYVVSLDDLQLPSREGIRHIRAWELERRLQGGQL
nr:ATP-binding protein [uncultured Prevotella sp.]